MSSPMDKAPEYKQQIVDGALKAAEAVEEPDRPDAGIIDGDGHSLGGLEVVIGAQDGVPYVSLADLEHVFANFANLYEDITERQARKQRQEAKVGESPTEQTWPVGSPERRKAEAALAEEQRVDAEDDRPLWRVELDYALNHGRNAVASWLGL